MGYKVNGRSQFPILAQRVVSPNRYVHRHTVSKHPGTHMTAQATYSDSSPAGRFDSLIYPLKNDLAPSQNGPK